MVSKRGGLLGKAETGLKIGLAEDRVCAVALLLLLLREGACWERVTGLKDFGAGEVRWTDGCPCPA